MTPNVFVYGTLFWFRTKLAKENEPEENPQDFPSTHKVNNGLYTLLWPVIFYLAIPQYNQSIDKIYHQLLK
jgi:hypothetical protein